MKVRVTCFWEDDEIYFKRLRKYAFGTSQWKDVNFVLGEDYDKLVILTRPNKNMHTYNSRKAITILTEPPESYHIQDHPTSEILPMYLPLPFWTDCVHMDIHAIKNNVVGKAEVLSSVTSEVSFLEGHRLRLELVYYLDRTIEEGFDLWGRKYHGDFFRLIKSYKGEIQDKYEALWRYKYHLACENSFVGNYFTEKIVDPIIAECLCFYDGCCNIEEFIDERAFVRIDVRDPFTAINRIIKAIETDQWSARIKYIRQQKRRLLYDLNPLNIIWFAVHEKDILKECKL